MDTLIEPLEGMLRLYEYAHARQIGDIKSLFARKLPFARFDGYTSDEQVFEQLGHRISFYDILCALTENDYFEDRSEYPVRPLCKLAIDLRMVARQMSRAVVGCMLDWTPALKIVYGAREWAMPDTNLVVAIAALDFIGYFSGLLANYSATVAGAAEGFFGRCQRPIVFDYAWSGCRRFSSRMRREQLWETTRAKHRWPDDAAREFDDLEPCVEREVQSIFTNEIAARHEVESKSAPEIVAEIRHMCADAYQEIEYRHSGWDISAIRNMKRKRTGDMEDEHQVCVVRISPLGSGAFGEPVGASDAEIGATVARVMQKAMSVDDMRATFNRTISYEMVPVGRGDPDSYARGFLRGLSYLRTPTVKDTFYAFDASLVHASALEAELEPSLASEDDEEVDSSSSEEEESSSEEDSVSEEEGDDAMVSGNTSESE